MNNQKRYFSRRKTVLFSVAIFVLLSGVIETVSYFLINWFSETGKYGERIIINHFHPFLGWDHPANAKIAAGGYFIHTDDRGRSITPLDFESPDVRIAVTGGSTMFGVGSSGNKSTVPSQIERIIFDRLNVKAEVYNLGVRGYQSFQEMLKLREFLLDTKVDIVISVSGRNDSFYSMIEPEPIFALLPKRVYQNAVSLVRRAEQEEPIVLNVDGYLRAISSSVDLFARLIRRFTARLRNQSFGVYSRASSGYSGIPERAFLTVTHFAMMKTLAEQYGSSFFFVLQPTLFTWNDYKETVFEGLAKDWCYHLEYEKRYYEELVKLRNRIEIHDMTAVMNDMSVPPYVDNCHYSDAGAQLLASAIVDLITLQIMDLVGTFCEDQ